VAGKEDDLGLRGLGFDEREKLQAGAARQFQVQEGQGEFFRLQRRQGLQAVRGGLHRISLALQELGEHL